MEIQIAEYKNIKLAEIIANEVIMSNIEDALDIIGNTGYQEVFKVIIHEENIIPEFFDLKTKIAGEILQKFVQYGIQLAIVGNFTKFESKSLHDFIYESNKQRQIYFAQSLEQAKEKLTE